MSARANFRCGLQVSAVQLRLANPGEHSYPQPPSGDLPDRRHRTGQAVPRDGPVRRAPRVAASAADTRDAGRGRRAACAARQLARTARRQPTPRRHRHLRAARHPGALGHRRRHPARRHESARRPRRVGARTGAASNTTTRTSHVLPTCPRVSASPPARCSAMSATPATRAARRPICTTGSTVLRGPSILYRCCVRPPNRGRDSDVPRIRGTCCLRGAEAILRHVSLRLANGISPWRGGSPVRGNVDCCSMHVGDM